MTKIINRMEEYLQEAEVLEEYGKWHFVMTRPQDTTPVRVSVSTSGISVTANNRYRYITVQSQLLTQDTIVWVI